MAVWGTTAVAYDARYGVPAVSWIKNRLSKRSFPREACWAPTVFKWPFSFTGFSTAGGGRQEVYLKRFWLLMCAVGTVLPYAMFIPWALKNGINLRLLIDEATPPIAAFAWLDVAVSPIVVFVLAIKQIVGGQSRFWLVVLGTCGVGCPWGLPLYLYLDPKSAPHTE
jgi:Terpene cyclase DEP1